MADYGIIETGFNRKRYEDIIADMRARARARFGDTVVLDTNKPLGKIFDVIAWQLAEVWEQTEYVYNGISIDTAEGSQLDAIVKYKGLTRYTERTATGEIQITGTVGLLVPVDFIVAKVNGITYSTTAAVTIGDTGTVVTSIRCNEIGSKGNAEIGEVNQIVTPITGITAVTNIRPIVNGRDNETDAQLRLRYKTTVGGLSTVESIRAAVAAVDGVTSVVVVENVTMETVNGIPPKAFQVYVAGGEDYNIALAILESKAAGIEAFGTTYVEVEDVNGYLHDIGFTRANEVLITVNVNIATNQYYSGTNGVTMIKDMIISYIGGELSDGTQANGLLIHQNVITSYISGLVWGVNGITDVNVTIARDSGTPSTDNIIIGEFEIARTMANIITVTEV